MPNRRLAIVAALGIVEIWIVGLMIRSVSCGSIHDSGVASAAAPVTAGASRTIETGPAPHVVIDDEDAELTVSVRPGTSVSVNEHVRVRGWGMRDAARPVKIEKTDDGVRIDEPDGVIVAGFGSASRKLEVIVPPGATLEVENAGATTVAGLRGDATVHSDDGSVAVSDHRGALTVTTDNGRIELSDVTAPALDVTTDNGRITLKRVESDNANVATDDGRIEISHALLRGGKIKSENGGIRLGLDPLSNVTVSAQTSSGKVVAAAPLAVTSGGTDDDAASLIRVGSGAGRLDVGSDDGSITVLAGGV